jgi:hypothetical protein
MSVYMSRQTLVIILLVTCIIHCTNSTNSSSSSSSSSSSHSSSSSSSNSVLDPPWFKNIDDETFYIFQDGKMDLDVTDGKFNRNKYKTELSPQFYALAKDVFPTPTRVTLGYRCLWPVLIKLGGENAGTGWYWNVGRFASKY